jgi:hypothetical protein
MSLLAADRPDSTVSVFSSPKQLQIQYGDASANPSLLIGTEMADPISGSLPRRSFLCQLRAE